MPLQSLVNRHCSTIEVKLHKLNGGPALGFQKCDLYLSTYKISTLHASSHHSFHSVVLPGNKTSIIEQSMHIVLFIMGLLPLLFMLLHYNNNIYYYYYFWCTHCEIGEDLSENKDEGIVRSQLKMGEGYLMPKEGASCEGKLLLTFSLLKILLFLALIICVSYVAVLVGVGW